MLEERHDAAGDFQPSANAIDCRVSGAADAQYLAGHIPVNHTAGKVLCGAAVPGLYQALGLVGVAVNGSQ